MREGDAQECVDSDADGYAWIVRPAKPGDRKRYGDIVEGGVS